jgi:hypothetical protein
MPHSTITSILKNKNKVMGAVNRCALMRAMRLPGIIIGDDKFMPFVPDVFPVEQGEDVETGGILHTDPVLGQANVCACVLGFNKRFKSKIEKFLEG